MTRVTIVIPVWNDRGTLTRCLESIERRTFRDVDVVVVDDGSEPPTEARGTSGEVRIRWIRQSHGGAPSARNRGARETTSEFVMFCDADITLRRMPYIHTTALIRRAHFPGFDESLTRFQDWDLWLTMLERGHVGIHIPEVLFTIQNTRGTMSRWIPSFVYRLPWKFRRVREYDAAAEIVHQKHRLPGRLTG